LLEVYAKGDSEVQQSLYLVHLGDWISWYLAQLRGVDAIEVKVIDFLKGELSKV
jgi:glucose/mannose-6-phosphate isomerase